MTKSLIPSVYVLLLGVDLACSQLLLHPPQENVQPSEQISYFLNHLSPISREEGSSGQDVSDEEEISQLNGIYESKGGNSNAKINVLGEPGLSSILQSYGLLEKSAGKNARAAADGVSQVLTALPASQRVNLSNAWIQNLLSDDRIAIAESGLGGILGGRVLNNQLVGVQGYPQIGLNGVTGGTGNLGFPWGLGVLQDAERFVLANALPNYYGQSESYANIGPISRQSNSWAQNWLNPIIHSAQKNVVPAVSVARELGGLGWVNNPYQTSMLGFEPSQTTESKEITVRSMTVHSEGPVTVQTEPSQEGAFNININLSRNDENSTSTLNQSPHQATPVEIPLAININLIGNEGIHIVPEVHLNDGSQASNISKESSGNYGNEEITSEPLATAELSTIDQKAVTVEAAGLTSGNEEDQIFEGNQSPEYSLGEIIQDSIARPSSIVRLSSQTIEPNSAEVNSEQSSLGLNSLANDAETTIPNDWPAFDDSASLNFKENNQQISLETDASGLNVEQTIETEERSLDPLSIDLNLSGNEFKGTNPIDLDLTEDRALATPSESSNQSAAVQASVISLSVDENPGDDQTVAIVVDGTTSGAHNRLIAANENTEQQIAVSTSSQDLQVEETGSGVPLTHLMIMQTTSKFGASEDNLTQASDEPSEEKKLSSWESVKKANDGLVEPEDVQGASDDVPINVHSEPLVAVYDSLNGDSVNSEVNESIKSSLTQNLIPGGQNLQMIIEQRAEEPAQEGILSVESGLPGSSSLIYSLEQSSQVEPTLELAIEPRNPPENQSQSFQWSITESHQAAQDADAEAETEPQSLLSSQWMALSPKLQSLQPAEGSVRATGENLSINIRESHENEPESIQSGLNLIQLSNVKLSQNIDTSTSPEIVGNVQVTEKQGSISLINGGEQKASREPSQGLKVEISQASNQNEEPILEINQNVLEGGVDIQNLSQEPSLKGNYQVNANLGNGVPGNTAQWIATGERMSLDQPSITDSYKVSFGETVSTARGAPPADSHILQGSRDLILNLNDMNEENAEKSGPEGEILVRESHVVIPGQTHGLESTAEAILGSDSTNSHEAPSTVTTLASKASHLGGMVIEVVQPTSEETPLTTIQTSEAGQVAYTPDGRTGSKAIVVKLKGDGDSGEIHTATQVDVDEGSARSTARISSLLAGSNEVPAITVVTSSSSDDGSTLGEGFIETQTRGSDRPNTENFSFSITSASPLAQITTQQSEAPSVESRQPSDSIFIEVPLDGAVDQASTSAHVTDNDESIKTVHEASFGRDKVPISNDPIATEGKFVIKVPSSKSHREQAFSIPATTLNSETPSITAGQTSSSIAVQVQPNSDADHTHHESAQTADHFASTWSEEIPTITVASSSSTDEAPAGSKGQILIESPRNDDNPGQTILYMSSTGRNADLSLPLTAINSETTSVKAVPSTGAVLTKVQQNGDAELAQTTERITTPLEDAEESAQTAVHLASTWSHDIPAVTVTSSSDEVPVGKFLIKSQENGEEHGQNNVHLTSSGSSAASKLPLVSLMSKKPSVKAGQSSGSVVVKIQQDGETDPIITAKQINTASEYAGESTPTAIHFVSSWGDETPAVTVTSSSDEAPAGSVGQFLIKSQQNGDKHGQNAVHLTSSGSGTALTLPMVALSSETPSLKTGQPSGSVIVRVQENGDADQVQNAVHITSSPEDSDEYTQTAVNFTSTWSDSVPDITVTSSSSSEKAPAVSQFLIKSPQIGGDQGLATLHITSTGIDADLSPPVTNLNSEAPIVKAGQSSGPFEYAGESVPTAVHFASTWGNEIPSIAVTSSSSSDGAPAGSLGQFAVKSPQNSDDQGQNTLHISSTSRDALSLPSITLNSETPSVKAGGSRGSVVVKAQQMDEPDHDQITGRITVSPKDADESTTTAVNLASVWSDEVPTIALTSSSLSNEAPAGLVGHVFGKSQRNGDDQGHITAHVSSAGSDIVPLSLTTAYTSERASGVSEKPSSTIENNTEDMARNEHVIENSGIQGTEATDTTIKNSPGKATRGADAIKVFVASQSHNDDTGIKILESAAGTNSSNLDSIGQPHKMSSSLLQIKEQQDGRAGSVGVSLAASEEVPSSTGGLSWVTGVKQTVNKRAEGDSSKGQGPTGLKLTTSHGSPLIQAEGSTSEPVLPIEREELDRESSETSGETGPVSLNVHANAAETEEAYTESSSEESHWGESWSHVNRETQDQDEGVLHGTDSHEGSGEWSSGRHWSTSGGSNWSSEHENPQGGARWIHQSSGPRVTSSQASVIVQEPNRNHGSTSGSGNWLHYVNPDSQANHGKGINWNVHADSTQSERQMNLASSSKPDANSQSGIHRTHDIIRHQTLSQRRPVVHWNQGIGQEETRWNVQPNSGADRSFYTQHRIHSGNGADGKREQRFVDGGGRFSLVNDRITAPSTQIRPGENHRDSLIRWTSANSEAAPSRWASWDGLEGQHREARNKISTPNTADQRIRWTSNGEGPNWSSNWVSGDRQSVGAESSRWINPTPGTASGASGTRWISQHNVPLQSWVDSDGGSIRQWNNGGQRVANTGRIVEEGNVGQSRQRQSYSFDSTPMQWSSGNIGSIPSQSSSIAYSSGPRMKLDESQKDWQEGSDEHYWGLPLNGLVRSSQVDISTEGERATKNEATVGKTVEKTSSKVAAAEEKSSESQSKSSRSEIQSGSNSESKDTKTTTVDPKQKSSTGRGVRKHIRKFLGIEPSSKNKSEKTKNDGQKGAKEVTAQDEKYDNVVEAS